MTDSPRPGCLPAWLHNHLAYVQSFLPPPRASQLFKERTGGLTIGDGARRIKVTPSDAYHIFVKCCATFSASAVATYDSFLHDSRLVQPQSSGKTPCKLPTFHHDDVPDFMIQPFVDVEEDHEEGENQSSVDVLEEQDEEAGEDDGITTSSSDEDTSQSDKRRRSECVGQLLSGFGIRANSAGAAGSSSRDSGSHSSNGNRQRIQERVDNEQERPNKQARTHSSQHERRESQEMETNEEEVNAWEEDGNTVTNGRQNLGHRLGGVEVARTKRGGPPRGQEGGAGGRTTGGRGGTTRGKGGRGRGVSGRS